MKFLTQLIQIPLDGFTILGFAYHYKKPSGMEAPYAVWQENGEASFHSDNQKSERALEGVIDFYTLAENDPKLDEIEAVLVDMGATWELTSVQHESESNLNHYSWDWSVS